MKAASVPAPARRNGPARRRAWPAPLGWVRRRFRAWWQARLPRTDTQLLTQRNIFILPSRAGLLFAATLLTLLIASINYQLNLGYVLTEKAHGVALASSDLVLQLQASVPV